MEPLDTAFRPLVVIPALNAASTLPSILYQLDQLDTLVVDDGSEDDTFLIAKAMATTALRHDHNEGHSAAIISGETFALTNGYSHVLLLDSDGQHPPEYAQVAINLLKTHDLVIGDRFSSLDKIPGQKIASNLFASLLIESATGVFLRDVSCGFRGYRLNQDLRKLTKLGYSRVYSQIVRAAIDGIRMARAKIPAIYSLSPPPTTRSSEIEGLCHAILTAVPANKAALSVVTALQKGASFTIAVKGVEFGVEKGFPGDDYRFSVDQQIALRLYAD